MIPTAAMPAALREIDLIFPIGASFVGFPIADFIVETAVIEESQIAALCIGLAGVCH
jgi:hypothetical protein